MIKAKLYGKPYRTELPIPKSETVPIAPPIKDLGKAVIALVTSGGIVPVDNPDRIQSASATRWGKYDISGLDSCRKEITKRYMRVMTQQQEMKTEPYIAFGCCKGI